MNNQTHHSQPIPGAQPFEMIFVSNGPFRMGTQKDDPAAPNFDPDTYGDEAPVHEVTVRDFYIGQYPVTQDVWTAIRGENPSFFTGDRRPVERVSWDDAQRFIQKLNAATEGNRPEGHTYRLPTEAEWEYAARGGAAATSLPFGGEPVPYFGRESGWGYKYAGSNKLKEVGWYADNSHGETKPVGLKDPNELGLYDMSGNVWEWCEDDWHGNYNSAPDDGSAWVDRPERGSNRVVRGGYWLSTAQSCRVAYRPYYTPVYRAYYLGFRLALAPQSVGQSSPAYL